MNNNIMEGRKMILRKIPIHEILAILQHLYSSGADFVDIVGMQQAEDKQDEILMAVKDEYMATEARDAYVREMTEEDIDDLDEMSKIDQSLKDNNILLTEEALNKLINGD